MKITKTWMMPGLICSNKHSSYGLIQAIIRCQTIWKNVFSIWGNLISQVFFVQCTKYSRHRKKRCLYHITYLAAPEIVRFMLITCFFTFWWEKIIATKLLGFASSCFKGCFWEAHSKNPAPKVSKNGLFRK